MRVTSGYIILSFYRITDIIHFMSGDEFSGSIISYPICYRLLTSLVVGLGFYELVRCTCCYHIHSSMLIILSFPFASRPKTNDPSDSHPPNMCFTHPPPHASPRASVFSHSLRPSTLASTRCSWGHGVDRDCVVCIDQLGDDVCLPLQGEGRY